MAMGEFIYLAYRIVLRPSCSSSWVSSQSRSQCSASCPFLTYRRLPKPSGSMLKSDTLRSRVSLKESRTPRGISWDGHLSVESCYLRYCEPHLHYKTRTGVDRTQLDIHHALGYWRRPRIFLDPELHVTVHESSRSLLGSPEQHVPFGYHRDW